jgi:hypothetical protein
LSASSTKKEKRKKGKESTHVLFLLTLDLDKVSRSAVTPPKLTGDAPVELTLEPAVPIALGLSGADLEFPGTSAL